MWLQFGDGWWSAPLTVGLWALFAAGLMVSRLPTISLKTARVPAAAASRPRWCWSGWAFAVLVAAPFLAMSAVAVGYLLLLPYTIYRYEWLKRHPEAWNMPTRERRAVARAARSARRLGLRSPLRRRVAGGRAERGARGVPAGRAPRRRARTERRTAAGGAAARPGPARRGCAGLTRRVRRR